MPKYQIKKVLVDTSFLITLFDDARPNHKVAKHYYKYFLDNGIELYLSTIVIAEFNQGQPISSVLGTGNFIALPFNIDDAIRTSEIAFQMGGVEKRGHGNPKYKDDIKLIAQADGWKIDFIITEDKSTLARYCENLKKGSIISTEAITIIDGYDTSRFNNGQTSLSV
jgi:predicted nucleic acid-binding protein